MNILNYPGFILAGILAVVLCIYVVRMRWFRADTEATIRFLKASLESAREQIRSMRK